MELVLNYQKIYNNLIEWAKINNVDDSLYYEKHHILPRCLGGTDEAENLVKMTPEQHYVAHQLLIKLYPDSNGLWFACKMMTMDLQGNRPNNKLYGWVRKGSNKKHSNLVKDKWAIKRGFVDYDDQCKYIWKLYSENEDMSTVDISKKLNIPLNNVQRSLSNYEEKYSLYEEMSKLRFIKKSKVSKLIREECKRSGKDNYRIKRTSEVNKITKRKPVSVDGIYFESSESAYTFLKITRNQLNYRLDSNNYPTWIRFKEK